MASEGMEMVEKASGRLPGGNASIDPKRSCNLFRTGFFEFRVRNSFDIVNREEKSTFDTGYRYTLLLIVLC